MYRKIYKKVQATIFELFGLNFAGLGKKACEQLLAVFTTK
jgi:hypothetical protein